MPEYLSPGVYIQEVDSGPKPIEGAGTATAAFVGFAAGGPVNKPVLVTNWTQYVESFGSIEDGGRRNPYLPGAYLAHSVYGYFQNGGGRCYVTRVSPPSTNGKASDHAKLALQLPSRASKAMPSLTITPKSDPTADIQVEVAAATAATAPSNGAAGDDGAAPEGAFTLRFRMADLIEEYPNVSFGKTKGSRNAVETINQASKLVSLLEAQATGPLAERAPEIGTYVIKMPEASNLPAVQATHFMGSASERSGVEGLEIAEDVTMIACPDLMSAYQAGTLDRDGVKLRPTTTPSTLRCTTPG